MARGHRPVIAMVESPSLPAESLASGQRDDLDQLDVEHERRIRRDDRRAASLAVAVLGRDEEIAPPADAHALEALVPAADHPAGPELERERLPPPRAVELRAAAVTRVGVVEPARVVHDGG